MRNPIIAALAIALSASPALAAQPMDLSKIDRAVAEFTGAEMGQPGGAKFPVDRRLRLADCRSPLTLQWFGRDQRSVQVSCPSAGWRIFVSVDAPSVGAGRVAQVDNTPVIKRGESVSILVRGKGFTLTRQGSAEEDGAQGQWIKVRATGDRKKTIRAIVLRPGRVGIELP